MTKKYLQHKQLIMQKYFHKVVQKCNFICSHMLMKIIYSIAKPQIHLWNLFFLHSELDFRVLGLLSITCAGATLTTRFRCEVYLSVAEFRFVLTGFCRVTIQWIWSSDSCTEVLVVLQTSFLLQRREWYSSVQYYSRSHLATPLLEALYLKTMHNWKEKRSDLLRWRFSRHYCIHNWCLFCFFIPRKKI